MNALSLVLCFISVYGLCRSVLAMISGYQQRLKVLAVNLSDYERQRVLGNFGWFKPLLGDLAALLERIQLFRQWVEKEQEVLVRSLRKAGDPLALTPREYLALRVLLLPLSLIIGYWVTPMRFQFFIIFIFALGFILPISWLADKTKNRIKSIEGDIPDALDTFSLIMSAGMGLDNAMDAYTRTQKRTPLMDEFYLLRAEMRVGRVREEALLDMGRRLGISDISNLATAIIQSEQTGISMSSFLASYAEDMRIKRFQAAEEQAQKAPVKMMLPLMLFVMPCVLLVLLGPMGINYINMKANL